MSKSTLATLALLGLAGCSNSTSEGGAAQNRLSAEGAVTLYEEVCINTLPNFSGARKKLSKLGASPTRAGGRVLHIFKGMHASFSVNTTGDKRVCTLIYSGDDWRGINTALARVGTPTSSGVFNVKGNETYQINTLSFFTPDGRNRPAVTVTIGTPK